MRPVSGTIEKRSVYLVVGGCGQTSYGDYHEWAVSVYTEKERAQEHVDLANMRIESDHPHLMETDDWNKYRESFPYDRYLSFFRDTTTYRVEEVPLVDHVDEFIELYRKA